MCNCRCMGHLYNPHMKIMEKQKFRCCSKSLLTSLSGQEKIESKSLTFWTQIRTAQTYLTQNANNFFIRTPNWVILFCWILDFVLFPSQLDSPSNSSGALSYWRNNLMLQQNLSQTTSPKVLRHLHLGPLALYNLGLVSGSLGTSSHLLGRQPLLLYK